MQRGKGELKKMNNTTIFKFNENGESEEAANIKNSYRGCVAIWKYMGDKYLGIRVPSSLIINSSDLEKMKKIWSLVNDTRITLEEAIVMATTLDDYLVKKEDVPTVIKAFREFEGDTSLPDQADILEKLIDDESCIGVGWHQNSMTCKKWFDYNCLNETNHYWLFDYLVPWIYRDKKKSITEHLDCLRNA